MRALFVLHSAQGEGGMVCTAVVVIMAVVSLWYRNDAEYFPLRTSFDFFLCICTSVLAPLSNVQAIVEMDEFKASFPDSAMGVASAKEQLPSKHKPADGSSEPRGEKRKWEQHKNKRQQQGSKRHKGRDMGRQEYLYVTIISCCSSQCLALSVRTRQGITNSPLKSIKLRQAQAKCRRTREATE